VTTQSSGSADDAALCPNCRARLADRYCSRCGQARHDGDPPTIQHFFHDLTHEILYIDGKIGRTVTALLSSRAC
jgi:predicted amidophosphoribosyltransferase